MSKLPRTEYEKARERLERYAEDGTIAEQDAELILEYCEAYDAESVLQSKPEGDSHKEVDTLRTYANNLARVGKNTELATATADDINRTMQAFLDGSADTVKDSGLAKSTTRTYQMVVKSFYGYHDDLDCSPENITSLEEQLSPIDPDDMLTRDEIHTLRDACSHARDRAIVDLFLYTGQRATAIRTLQIKHIDLQEGTYKLNSEADGLKGADENAKRRPLLLAESSVRNWIELHPASDDPEAYLITPKPRYSSPDPSEPASHDIFTYLMSKLKDETGIDKPLHPHALRHNFVTIAKRDYDMDNEVIKHLIGHAPGSRVMETTYAHLSDDDFIQAARNAVPSIDDGENPESSLTPQVCPQCSANVEDGAKACPKCGTIFTPDARGAQGVVREKTREQKEQAEDLQEYKDADQIMQAVEDDPELAAQLAQKFSELANDE
jgi:integrase